MEIIERDVFFSRKVAWLSIKLSETPTAMCDFERYIFLKSQSIVDITNDMMAKLISSYLCTVINRSTGTNYTSDTITRSNIKKFLSGYDSELHFYKIFSGLDGDGIEEACLLRLFDWFCMPDSDILFDAIQNQILLNLRGGLISYTPFFYYCRSDSFVSEMSIDIIIELLSQMTYGFFVEDDYNPWKIVDDNSGETKYDSILQAACFLYIWNRCKHRLDPSSTIITSGDNAASKAYKVIKEHQLGDGSWGYNTDCREGCLETTCVVIHSLGIYSAEPSAFMLERACKWLQNKWVQESDYWGIPYADILCIDSLNLCKGNLTQITFKVQSKTQTAQEEAHENIPNSIQTVTEEVHKTGPKASIGKIITEVLAGIAAFVAILFFFTGMNLPDWFKSHGTGNTPEPTISSDSHTGTPRPSENSDIDILTNAITPTPTTKIIKYAAEETPSLAGYFTNKYPANEYSAEKLITLGDYFYEIEMYDKAIECYLSNQVITDYNARKSVQAKLGKCFLYGENQISDDPQLREQYILVALNFLDAALTEGDYSALTTIIIIRAYIIKAYYYVTSYSFDKLIDNIELAYEVKNETISKWISAMMRDQDYIESEDGYLEQFCNRLSSYDQMVLLSNLVDPSWSSYYDSYTEYHPNVSSEDGYHQETLVNEYNGIYTYKVSDYIPTYRYYEFFVDKDMYDFFHSNTEEFLRESKEGEVD